MTDEETRLKELVAYLRDTLSGGGLKFIPVSPRHGVYLLPSQEGPMAKSRLSSLSVDALLKLRDDIGDVLSRKAKQLKYELSMLGESGASTKGGRRGPMKGRKVAVKFRDKAGNTWAGRGAQPVWLRERLKAGAKLEDFAVGEQRTARKTAGRPRRAKK